MAVNGNCTSLGWCTKSFSVEGAKCCKLGQAGPIDHSANERRTQAIPTFDIVGAGKVFDSALAPFRPASPVKRCEMDAMRRRVETTHDGGFRGVCLDRDSASQLASVVAASVADRVTCDFPAIGTSGSHKPRHWGQTCIPPA